MMKILLVVASLFAGVAAGVGVARFFAAQHRYPRAVMGLAEAQLAQLAAALEAQDCGAALDAGTRLAATATEIRHALPLTYAGDADFRARVGALQAALRPSASGGCAMGREQLRRAREACDACHREYR